MIVYLHKNGVRLGPLKIEEVNTRVAEAELAGTDPAWVSGWAKWQTLSCVPGFIPREEPPPFEPVLEPAPMAPPPIEPAPMEPAQASAQDSSAQEEKDPDPILFYIPTARLLVMSCLTLGIYQALWSYRNWRFLRDRHRLEVRPFWRAWFLIFYTHSLFRHIAEHHNSDHRITKQFSPGSWATLWVIAWVVSNSLAQNIGNQLWLLPIISLLPVCFMMPAQNCIVRLNEAQPVRPAYHGWSGGQVILLFLGIVVWALNIFGATQDA